jgi:hypothetical protein
MDAGFINASLSVENSYWKICCLLKKHYQVSGAQSQSKKDKL